MTILSSVSPGVALLITFGIVAGMLATRGMDVVMARLPEGETPPFVASGVLTEQNPDSAPKRLAAVVHHAAGWLTGPLYVTLLLLVGNVLGDGVVTYLLTAVVLLVLMVGFFAVVVLPRPGLARQRVRTITRDWAVSAAAYLLVLVPLVAGAAGVLSGL
ncbi:MULTISPECIES: hypothetical protein [Halomicrobium]|uniref:Uncharacterized protein n=2 Tax=Halomicrobium mukohataei TaxID=57705 RepID=C7P043_HALMD|nr:MULTISPECIES: hypothetical protein [Halomicrobium]ACV46951.1 conserved hypothetical protein [Halomicrobium mukohataei DSM 12286]QCD65446.1 hypothetical protein E5139_07265 [Halomicrobium mukohataei]QFR20252.1 hypothetical protein GBQ70_07260 [Halomicrobium sp. ZPS1]